MAHATDTLNKIAVSTLQAFEKSGVVQDTIFGGDPLLALLTSKGKKQVEGGENIQVNLRYGKNTNVGSYSGLDTLTKGELNTIAKAHFGWKQYYGAFVIPNIELKQNAGNRTKIVDLWKEAIEVTTLSMQDDMIADLYGDGTGNGGKDLLGLRAILSDTGILGGIDRSLAPWWKAKVTNAAGAAPTLRGIKDRIRAIRGPGGRPDKSGKVDMLLCNSDMYSYIDSLVDAKSTQTVISGPVAKIGFDSITISGAELTWSESVPAGEIWYVSTEYLGIRVLPGSDFNYTDPIQDIQAGVDSTSAYCLWAGNLTVSNCRYLGRDYGYVLP